MTIRFPRSDKRIRHSVVVVAVVSGGGGGGWCIATALAPWMMMMMMQVQVHTPFFLRYCTITRDRGHVRVCSFSDTSYTNNSMALDYSSN